MKRYRVYLHFLGGVGRAKHTVEADSFAEAVMAAELLVHDGRTVRSIEVFLVAAEGQAA